ncbi:helix-turn-helix transcriptional regulator [Enterococcus faecium]|uniref:helix-turn-helix domain-containing protein n=1 Tax=Enterococcus durans TaxID=53345 RepID=UPI0017E6C4C3|nr:helix-turn-helix transcriptional regulator [Enterococcus durans]MCA6741743.1 helix-turn-helix domain-containing protein [Enterococcus durans]NVD83120.1 helix-turn-helix transcriptional regulator [Enterococcus faecium]NVF25893.1 helix-turn-helix transcriptional regulator [Enterococcus faecium]
MEFGEKLKELRTSRGLGVNQLALKSGVSASQISRFEKGERKDPTLETLKKLSVALGVSISYFEENSPVNVELIPDWANENDLIELDKLLESNVNMAYGGETLTPEEIQRVKDILTATFWDIKKGRKSKVK